MKSSKPHFWILIWLVYHEISLASTLMKSLISSSTLFCAVRYLNILNNCLNLTYLQAQMIVILFLDWQYSHFPNTIFYSFLYLKIKWGSIELSIYSNIKISSSPRSISSNFDSWRLSRQKPFRWIPVFF